MAESIFDWAERMISKPSWVEHESAAHTGLMGGMRGGGPALSFSLTVETAECPPAPRAPFQEHGWWRWTVKAHFRGARYKVVGHQTSKAASKNASVDAMRMLLGGFRGSQ